MLPVSEEVPLTAFTLELQHALLAIGEGAVFIEDLYQKDEKVYNRKEGLSQVYVFQAQLFS